MTNLVVDLYRSSETAGGSILRHGRVDQEGIRLLEILVHRLTQLFEHPCRIIFLVASVDKYLAASWFAEKFIAVQVHTSIVTWRTIREATFGCPGQSTEEKVVLISPEAILLGSSSWLEARKIIEQYDCGQLTHFPPPFGATWLPIKLLAEVVNLLEEIPAANAVEQAAAIFQTCSNGIEPFQFHSSSGDIYTIYSSKKSEHPLLERVEGVASPTFIQSEWDHQFVANEFSSSNVDSAYSPYLKRHDLVCSQVKGFLRPTQDLLPELTSARSERSTLVFISTKTGYSGAEESLSLTIEALKVLNLQMAVFVGSKGISYSRFKALGIHVSTFDECSSDPIVQLSALHSFLRCTRPSAVHFNGTEPYYILTLAKALNQAVIQHIRFSKLVGLGTYLSIADKVVTVSHYVKKLIEKQSSQAKSEVIYNLLPVATPASRKVGNGSSRYILALCRITRDKNLQFAIKLLHQLRHTIHDLRLIVCGETLSEDADYLLELKSLAASLDLSEVVEWRRFDRGNRTLLIDAEFLINACESEPFARTTMEAILSGTPVLAPKSAGFVEQIPDRWHHTLYSPDCLTEAGSIANSLIHDLPKSRYLEDCQNHLAQVCSRETHCLAWTRVLDEIGMRGI